jgi:hypothetical protein
VKKVTYAELRSGVVDLNGEEVRTSSLSSYRKARKLRWNSKNGLSRGKSG